ncbi:LysR family transcriptional regulator [Affinibrenneria salicis]|uniref:LysR family transcriptional regulator n=1 Tax=Affinibrenneria salicis TaxID=2590031 RepID=A0A5J5G1S4_9GAMM|nr:LysR family transcriptional regulator [Affinibrenneria salicis]KAA9000490.1 LysR family transcriptional regulator [Affinibrenneria salicis]
MDSLNALSVFVQVADTRSFVVAGRNLGISASAIGKNITRLETRLGVRLFHRSTRSITLTQEGLLFLERSRRILAEMEAAREELSEATGQPRGRLRVSLPLVSALMLPVLADFMRHYPQIELDLDFTDRVVDVIEEGFDAVVRTGELNDSGLSVRKLGEYRQHIVASPDYLARYGEPREPTDLLRHRCLHYRYSNSGKREKWPLPEEVMRQLPHAMVCNNIETRVCFTREGLGIAWLPEFAVRDELTSGRLQIVLPQCKSQSAFYVLWPSGRFMTPRLRAFVDFLCQRVFPPQLAG